ncbi:MAG: alpha/beta fold hydrolase [Chloroflexi bacterium]|nr:alpha/beta fold hydrolase [Chloroflexota bacterium]
MRLGPVLSVAAMASLLLCFPFASSFAQEATEPILVQVTTSDGVVLAGDFYVPAVVPAPAVLVFHQNNSDRTDARPLAEPLVAAGYAVLAVDQRGVGGSGGFWMPRAEIVLGDIRAWLAWLREQPEVRTEAVFTLGSSTGGLLALAGCADDAGCRSAIALSPTRDGNGLSRDTTEQMFAEPLRTRSVFLMVSVGDSQFDGYVREMIEWSRGELGVYFFTGAAHGENLFTMDDHREQVVELIVDWLDAHLPEGEG